MLWGLSLRLTPHLESTLNFQLQLSICGALYVKTRDLCQGYKNEQNRFPTSGEIPHPGSVGLLYMTAKLPRVLGTEPSHWAGLWAGRVPWTLFLATAGGTVVSVV